MLHLQAPAFELPSQSVAFMSPMATATSEGLMAAAVGDKASSSTSRMPSVAGGGGDGATIVRQSPSAVFQRPSQQRLQHYESTAAASFRSSSSYTFPTSPPNGIDQQLQAASLASLPRIRVPGQAPGAGRVPFLTEGHLASSFVPPVRGTTGSSSGSVAVAVLQVL